MLLAIAVCALYQDWVIVPTAVVVAVVDFALVVFGPDELDPYDLLPVLATLLVCLVHHRTWQLAEETARTDPLTGLGNRRRLAEATDRMLRQDGPLSVLFCDLDGFKGVNDSRGHLFGDQLLAEVAGRIGAGVRSGDLVVRLGGDEFAVLVPGPPVHATDVARRLRTALRVPVQLTGRPVTVTASIGSRPRPPPSTGTPRSCCATPTSRCTRPSPPAGTASSPSPPAWPRRSPTASSSPRTSPRRWPPGTSSRCTTSPS